MNNWLAHLLDRRIGVVLCFLLTLFEKLRQWVVPGVRTLPPVGRILFVKPVEQGAIVLAHGAIRHAVDRVGRDNVFFFAFAKNREILDIMDLIPRENVITAGDTNLFSLAFGLAGAVLKMRRLRIDTAVDLEIFARISIIIAYLSGARRRVGLHRFNSEGPYRGALVTHRVQYNPYLHTAQAFDIFVRAAFAEPEAAPLLKETPRMPLCPPPRFTPSRADTAAVEALLPFLAEGQTPPSPLVLMNPKCLDELPARKWPDPFFIALGQKVLDAYPEGIVVITGLPDEQALCAQMAAAIHPQRCVSLAGKLSLRTLITLMTKADALVSSDSGPAHFAAMTAIGGVVLFGPETPLLYSPLSTRLHVVYLGLACSPCFSPMNYRLSPCSDNRCMLNLTVDHVFDELRTVLSQGD